MTRRVIVTLSILVLTSVGHAVATPILDQVNLPTNVALGGPWQEGITAGVTGWLTEVDVFLMGSGSTVDLAINLGAPWQADSPEFAQSILTNGSGVYSIDLTPAHIFVNMGDVFVLGLASTGFPPPIRGSFVAAPSGAYPGDLYSGGLLWTNQGIDLGFRTFVDPVPEPSVGLLLAAGLGLVVLRRRLA